MFTLFKKQETKPRYTHLTGLTANDVTPKERSSLLLVVNPDIERAHRQSSPELGTESKFFKTKKKIRINQTSPLTLKRSSSTPFTDDNSVDGTEPASAINNGL